MEIEKLLKQVYKKRKRWCHKYDFGHLLVIGGSKVYSGSPTFNALAALRSGVDLVTIVAPERAANLIASFKPDLITYPLVTDYFTSKNLKEVLELAKKKDAVVIGGGMGRKEETLKFVRKFLEKINLPTVIDADALYAVSKNLKLLKEKPFVLTPHSYEFFILSNLKLSTRIKERKKAVEEFAKKWETTVLLKGHWDVISNGKKTWVNKSGSPFMTKGGFGDCLAGIIGALLARKIKPFEAACLGAFINGKAGELAAKKWGEGLIASDLIDELPKVIKLMG